MKITRIINHDYSIYNSNEMLRMITKIGYEYYCRENNIYEKRKEFQSIIDFIICNRVDRPSYIGIIEVVTDRSLYENLNKNSIGGHTFAIVTIQDGREYVIFSLFGIVIYKVWIKPKLLIHNKSIKHINISTLLIISADGIKCLAKLLRNPLLDIPSKPPHVVTTEIQNISAKYFEEIMSTSFVSLRVQKRNMDYIIQIANQVESDERFNKLIGYRDNKIIDGIIILKKLAESEKMLDFSKSLNANFEKINGSDTYRFDDSEILKVLSNEYSSGNLIDLIKNGYNIFMEFYNQEVK